MLTASFKTDDTTASILFHQMGIDSEVIHTVMDIRHEFKEIKELLKSWSTEEDLTFKNIRVISQKIEILREDLFFCEC